MNIQEHWLDCATHIPSPNCDLRPDANDISLIVLHCISLPPGKFDARFIHQFFCNQLNPADDSYFRTIDQLKVSAHILINRQGVISQYVPFDKRAWHAGHSEYAGRSRCNDFSIGIELQGTETTAYTDRQYQQLALLIKVLLKHYPGLSRSRITGHSDIAPGRKSDPGESFDWRRLFQLLDKQADEVKRLSGKGVDKGA